MGWGFFGAGEVEDFHNINGILNKEGYHSILQQHAIPCWQRLIEQDNDLEYCSKCCKMYLGKKPSAGILSVMYESAQTQISTPSSCCGSSFTVWFE